MTAALVSVIEMLRLRLPSRVIRGLIVAMLLELMPRRRGAAFWADAGVRAIVAGAAGAALFGLLVAGRY
ncbi:MAG TPA: hypothetical protein VKW09_01100 [bacterium]|nr:hypothetical protein [bacterium]